VCLLVLLIIAPALVLQGLRSRLLADGTKTTPERA